MYMGYSTYAGVWALIHGMDIDTRVGWEIYMQAYVQDGGAGSTRPIRA